MGLPSEPPRSHQISQLDKVLRGMAHAGLGRSAISEFLGVGIEEVDQRVIDLGAPRPHDRPMRKPGPRGWSTIEVRTFTALWLDDVAIKSIAAAIGRSPGGLYSKRRRLGLDPRPRSATRERSAEACLAIRLPWTAIAAQDEIVSAPETTSAASFWNEETTMRCSMLAMAGLNNAAVAKQLTIEFGRSVTESAVKCRVNRLQIVRDRKDMMAEYVEELIEPRANARIKALRWQLRRCEGTGRVFWYSPVLGGSRNTCREFNKSQKFSKRRRERENAAHIMMA